MDKYFILLVIIESIILVVILIAKYILKCLEQRKINAILEFISDRAKNPAIHNDFEKCINEIKKTNKKESVKDGK